MKLKMSFNCSVWLSISYSVFKFGFASWFLRVDFVFLRTMLPLKVWLMRFRPSFILFFFVISGCNSLWIFVQFWLGNYLDWCHHVVLVMIFVCVSNWNSLQLFLAEMSVVSIFNVIIRWFGFWYENVIT